MKDGNWGLINVTLHNDKMITVTWPWYRLTHWGRVTHICVGNLISLGPDNGLSPGRRQAIIWTDAGILLIGPLGTNFSEILIDIHTFSFTKMHLKMSSAKWCPFCLGLNVLSPLSEAPATGNTLYDWYKSTYLKEQFSCYSAQKNVSAPRK